MSEQKRDGIRLDVLGLFLAGLINTFLALLDAVVLLGPGTEAQQPDVIQRTAWIAGHVLRWQGGWLFWFAVTLSFAWSFYALSRHLGGNRPWRDLAVGLAVIAAAIDLVGVLVNLIVLPEISLSLADAAPLLETTLLIHFQSMEKLSYALTNVAAFGLYSVAGLLLLPALFSTGNYPRWLAWLGTLEWSLAALSTILLVLAPMLATVPLLFSFGLYAPWVWSSGVWLLRGGGDKGDMETQKN